jgi:class 3 adenylate cyclase
MADSTKAILKNNDNQLVVSYHRQQQDELELQKQQAEKDHEAETRQRTLAAGGLVLFILAGGLFGRLRYVRKTKKIIEKERDRSENLLLNILPAEVAAELKEKGESEARDFDNVSVLFSDFQSFTQTSEKLTAKELVTELNMCFKKFDEIVQKYEVEKIKTIGDAYMAAGGLHIPRTSEPKDVVMAALEMQQFMLDRKLEKEAEGQVAFSMRVGIHTGPVVAGIVGIKKFQYDIWGDTVNTASRMESNGEVGKVNISQTTYEMLKDDPQFVFESRGKIEAKGKGEMEMYFISKA